jgi:hypothetical protein
MWNVKTSVVPVIMRETGTVVQSFRKYLRNALYVGNTKSRKYKKQPFWALHTHCGM